MQDLGWWTIKSSSYLKNPIPSLAAPDYAMGGISGSSVKRSRCCSISVDLVKIEPGHFPGGRLRFRPRTGPDMSRWGTVERSLRLIGLTVSVLLGFPLGLLLKLLLVTENFLFFCSCTQGGVPKEVLFRPGLQVPALYF